MVLNHSSTPIDLEQVEQTWPEQATQTEVKFKKETGSKLKKTDICLHPKHVGGMTFFFASLSDGTDRKHVWNTELPDNTDV